MLLQCRMLPKRFVAGGKLRAAVLFPSLMGGIMSSQPRCRQELLSASVLSAYMVSFICMSAFCMVTEMCFTEKPLATVFKFAMEGPFVCM